MSRILNLRLIHAMHALTSILVIMYGTLSESNLLRRPSGNY